VAGPAGQGEGEREGRRSVAGTALEADRHPQRPAPVGASGGHCVGESDRGDQSENGIDLWFLRRFKSILAMEQRLLSETLTPDLLVGGQAARLSRTPRSAPSAIDCPSRCVSSAGEWGIRPVYKMVDTCAAEFEAATPYFYSTYEDENEALPLEGEKAAVIGSGPIRIGQGIEFDYCSVTLGMGLTGGPRQKHNDDSNPETVSTDFDTSDRLYFEPLDEESVRDILENEGWKPRRPSLQLFGGPNCDQSGGAALPRRGPDHRQRPVEAIDLAEDREAVRELPDSSRHSHNRRVGLLRQWNRPLSPGSADWLPGPVRLHTCWEAGRCRLCRMPPSWCGTVSGSG